MKRKKAGQMVVIQDDRGERATGPMPKFEAKAVRKAFRKRAKKLGRDWRIDVISVT